MPGIGIVSLTDLDIASTSPLFGGYVTRHSNLDRHLGLDGAVIEDDLQRPAFGNQRWFSILQVTHIKQMLLQEENGTISWVFYVLKLYYKAQMKTPLISRVNFITFTGLRFTRK